MSLHRSLKTKPGALNEHRNVLTRTERITRLVEQGRYDPSADPPIGMVKVANRQPGGKKKKPAKEAQAAETAGGAPAVPAPGKSTPAGKAAPAGKSK
jgi:small basic protein (TIGR04137 family)